MENNSVVNILPTETVAIPSENPTLYVFLNG